MWVVPVKFLPVRQHGSPNIYTKTCIILHIVQAPGLSLHLINKQYHPWYHCFMYSIIVSTAEGIRAHNNATTSGTSLSPSQNSFLMSSVALQNTCLLSFLKEILSHQEDVSSGVSYLLCATDWSERLGVSFVAFQFSKFVAFICPRWFPVASQVL